MCFIPVDLGLLAPGIVLQHAHLGYVVPVVPTVEVVAESTNGQGAIDLVERKRPSVVVLDVRMPSLDGLAATRAIKAPWPGVGVVLITTHPECRDEARAAGADAFVSKLDPPEILISAIRAVMA